MIRSTDNFLIRYATPIAISGVTILILIAALIFYRQAEAGMTARNWVVHTYDVRSHIRKLSSLIKDAQIGERGYLLTGEKEYLRPYTDAITPAAKDDTGTVFDKHYSIQEEIEILRKLVADNPLQVRNLAELESILQELLQYFAISISKGEDAAKEEAITHHGKQLMELAKVLIRVMESEESRLLATRMEIDEANSKVINTLAFGGFAAFYFIIVLSIWLYQRSRARAQAQLMRYTQELERSEEELKMQQEELKASNEEIEASNEELEEKTRALEEQNIKIRKQSEELSVTQKIIEKKAEELELASKYKSEFLANMSHELRTPLNSLLILARLLASNEEGNLTENQVEEAHVIYNGGLELLNLINDILDLSKVEAGKLTIAVEEVCIEDIVKRLQQQFLPVAKEKNISFLLKIAKDTPPYINTDTQRVEQILKNLLSNAFKFTASGAVTLEISRPAETIEFQRISLGHNNAVVFSVKDTGIGIDTSKLQDIFEAFQQEEGSTDRHYGGTGLGLTIARKFARLLGGEIHVTSEKGVGSTFSLVLPLALTTQQSAIPNFVSDSSSEGNKIELRAMPKTLIKEFITDDRNSINDSDKVLLIIEDDAVFSGTLAKMARKRGYKCLCAGDGKTGLLMALQWKINAVILDLKLPDIDGVQVLDHFKGDLKLRHVPVHIISGRDESEGVVPLRKGAIGYLAKPAEKEDIEDVFTRIELLLQADVKRVLVVEDDRKNQLAIQSLLNKKDIEIIVADTGEAGQQQIRNARFDCIILDLHLPDMSGFEWLGTIEKIMGENRLPPVIIYTAKELTEEENRNLARYAQSIIIKGAKSPERLLDEVTLFLHTVESTLSDDQQEIIRMQHNPNKVLQNRTLLLVDDDLRNTFALSKLLQKHGMNVIIADNGQMAIDKLKENKSIELVIMDIMMPVMDGYQAMTEIRSIKSLKQMPIIALTARAMPDEQEKCIQAGANDYLTKPVDIERLLTLLRVWLFKQEMAA